MRDFLNECRPKKMSKAELADLILDFQKEVINFVVKKDHLANNKQFAETFEKLYNRMNSMKFAKALKYIIKEDDMELDKGMAVVITGFIERNPGDAIAQDVRDAYAEIILKLLKKQSKKISKKCGVPTDVVTELLVVAPSKEYISSDKFVGVYSQKMLRKLYFMANDHELGLSGETKQLNKLFTAIFGEELIDLIAVNILLEKKEALKNMTDKQKSVWNIMTAFALDTIEGEKKAHIVELLEYYCQRRANDNKAQRDTARRISMSTVDPESYPKLAKAVSKLSDTEKFEKYL